MVHRRFNHSVKERPLASGSATIEAENEFWSSPEFGFGIVESFQKHEGLLGFFQFARERGYV